LLNWQKILFYLLPPVLLLTVVLLVNFKTDLSAFIIAGDDAEDILLASEMQTGTLSRRYLISVVSAEQTSVSQTFIIPLKDQLKAIDGVVDVWSPGQQGDVMETLQTLYKDYSNALFSLNPEQDLPQIFSEQGLQERAGLLKQALLSPQAGIVKQIALNDPLLLTLRGFQAVGKQMQKSVPEGNNFSNLIVETAMAGLDAPEQSRIQKEIYSIFKQLNHSSKQSYHLEITGVPVFATATQSLIQGDITKVSILSSIILLVLFLLIFRSFNILFQVFTLLIIVILSSILSTHLVFGYVHGMTVAIGSTLVGICIDYPIHAVAHAQSVSSENRTSVIAKIWPSMLLGGTTTMIGYVALGISGYPGFQQVAVYAATGILLSLFLTRFILPSLNTKNTSQSLKIPLVAHWATICQQYRVWLILLLLVFIATSAYGLKSLHWMKDMQELTPELNYLKDNDKRIRARMTNIEPGRFVMVTGKTIEQVLQKTEAIYPVLEKLKQSGNLADYFGLYPWLLSSHQQQLNQSLLQKYLTADNQKLWEHALKKQGLSVKSLGTFPYTESKALTLDQVFKTPIKKLIDSRIITTGQQTIIIIWLGQHQPEAIQKALETIEDVQYFSQRDMLNNMTKDYTNRAKKLLSIGLFLIILLLLVRYRSLFKTLQTLLPAFLAAFLILGIWAFTGEAISFLHLVGFLLVVAICVDYGIFYQENRGGNILLTYQAMAASMLTSAVAFGCLILAESTSLKILAGVVTLGVILGFILCPLIIKSSQASSATILNE